MTTSTAVQPCRRGTTRVRRPPIAAALEPATAARLLAEYRINRQAWRTSGLISEVRERMETAYHTLQAAADAVGGLKPIDLTLTGRSRPDVGQQLAALEGLAAAISDGLTDLAARGGGRGGSRPAAALFRPTPRFILAVDCRSALARQLGRRPKRRELVTAIETILIEAGEVPIGVEDLLRDLPPFHFGAEPTPDRPGSALAQAIPGP